MKYFVASQICHSKTRSSHEEVPWHSKLRHLSCGQQLLLWRRLLEHKDGLLEIVPLIGQISHWFLSRDVIGPFRWEGWQQEDDDKQTGLGDLNFMPTCVLHSGTSCLRVHIWLTMCNLSRWKHGADRPQTHSKPVVWSDAYKYCFFFCLLYEMCYFALSLLKNTFLKKQIMWMFTVYMV